MTATTRLNVTMGTADGDLVARAATVMGVTVARFVRAAATEKAQTTLDHEIRITLSEQDFAELSTALGGVFKPTLVLKSTLAEANRSVRRF